MKAHIHLYDAVNRPFGVVRGALVHKCVGLLEEAAAAGLTGARDTALDIAFGGLEVAKEVHLDVHGFKDIPGHVPLGRVSIRCTPADHSMLFPIIEADLEAEPIDDERTMMSLLGMYQPPLGLVGAALDRIGFHRLAETAFDRFFHRLLAVIEHHTEDRAVSAEDLVPDTDSPTRVTITG